MKQFPLILTLFLIGFLAACGGSGTTPPPTVPPSTPGTGPVPTPGTPTTPPPTNSSVPYYGEWIVTYTSDYDVTFVHALQVTTDVSSATLRNAGGGLQEFCTGGVSGNECEGIYGSGIGFIGELVLDDGTAPLSLAIATSYGGESPELKIATLEPIQIQTNAQGQQTFTTRGGWALSTGTIDTGTITATNIGTPKMLEPLTKQRLKQSIKAFEETLRSFH